MVFRPAGRQEDHHKRRDLLYHNAYRFDLVKSVQQPRATWIHLSDSLPGYGQNEIQLAPKDRINIGFCIYNLNGFVDMATAAWQHPQIVSMDENMVDFLQYNRDKQIQMFNNPRNVKHFKILCDIDRVCDVEDSVYDWIPYDPKSFHQARTI